MDVFSGELVTRIVKATATAEGPRQQVELGFAAYFELMVDNEQAFRLLYGRDAPDDPELGAALRRVEEVIAEAIDPLIDAGLDPAHRLLLAHAAPVRPAVGPWRDFTAQGALADLASVDVIARAITPPSVGKRFDTWFLLADADRLMSLDRQPDCGELEEIAWVDFDEAQTLPLPTVTRMMLKEAVLRMDDPGRPKPFMRFRQGAMRPDQL